MQLDGIGTRTSSLMNDQSVPSRGPATWSSVAACADQMWSLGSVLPLITATSTVSLRARLDLKQLRMSRGD